MKNVKKKAIYCNFLICSGLFLSGYGLFLWVGLGPALFAPGSIITCLGIYGAIN